MWQFVQQHWRDGVEILILAALAYQGYLFLRATRGARILTGLLVLLLSLTIISDFLQLKVISQLMGGLSAFIAIGAVVIFQPELRRMLAELGSQRLFSFNQTDEASLDQLIEAMEQLSHKRIGALIAIRRGIDLTQYAESGVEIDAKISSELLNTIFHPKTPLHDGGIIVEQGRIMSGGCVFPVSQREVRDRAVGLRHRAALGITEETDAIALVVSEETGALSLCFKGKLMHDLEADVLREHVNRLVEEGSLDDDEESDHPQPRTQQRLPARSPIWPRMRAMLTRSWREKLVAGIIAFFFWNTLKQQLRPNFDGFMSSQQQEVLREHSLKQQAVEEIPRRPTLEQQFIQNNGLRGQSGLE